MNQLSISKKMTSREIADITGKNHKEILRSIRNMERGWEKVTQRKFALSEYTDSTGRRLPQYELTKTECLYIATKFNDEARAKLIIRWEALELERLKGFMRVPASINVYGIKAMPYDWWLLQHGYSVSSGQRGRRIRNYPQHFYKTSEGKWYISGLYASALLKIKEGKRELNQIPALPKLEQVEMFLEN